MFEGEMAAIELAAAKKADAYQPPSPFPAVQRDVNILVQKSIPAEDIMRTFRASGGDLLQNVVMTDIYEHKELGADKRSLLFYLTFQSQTKNLKSDIVDKFMEKIISNLVKHHQAVQR